MPTEKQIKTLSKIFKKSGRTFQSLALEAGLNNVPDHVYELTEAEASELIKIHGVFLMKAKKRKQ